MSGVDPGVDVVARSVDLSRVAGDLENALGTLRQAREAPGTDATVLSAANAGERKV